MVLTLSMGWDRVWVVRLIILAQLNEMGVLSQGCGRDGGRVGCLDWMVLLMMIAASAEVGRGWVRKERSSCLSLLDQQRQPPWFEIESYASGGVTASKLSVLCPHSASQPRQTTPI